MNPPLDLELAPPPPPTRSTPPISYLPTVLSRDGPTTGLSWQGPPVSPVVSLVALFAAVSIKISIKYQRRPIDYMNGQKLLAAKMTFCPLE